MPKAVNATYNKLPKPLYETYKWQEEAACRGMDTELFYLPENSRGTNKQTIVTAAKKICATCTVKSECLEYALAIDEPYGVWGGMSEEERRYLKLKMATYAK